MAAYLKDLKCQQGQVEERQQRLKNKSSVFKEWLDELDHMQRKDIQSIGKNQELKLVAQARRAIEGTAATAANSPVKFHEAAPSKLITKKLIATTPEEEEEDERAVQQRKEVRDAMHRERRKRLKNHQKEQDLEK